MYLLSALLAFFILDPILVNTASAMHLFGILFSIVIFFCIYVLRRGKIIIITAIILASIIIVGYWSSHVLHNKNQFFTIEYYLIILFFSFITIIVLGHVMSDREVNLNTLCGAICGYFLIALLWSFVYVLIHHSNPHSFVIPAMQSNSFEDESQLFIYFSFSTQSTLGYGDIIPTTNIGRTFCWLQAVTGQIYLTVWIAQLVGMHIVAKSTKRRKAS